MKKTKHTKGCWIAVGHWIEHEDDNVPDIANFNPESMGQSGRSGAEICANALLCSMAPEMLRLLKGIQTALKNGYDGNEILAANGSYRAAIRDVISCATGGKP